MRWQLGTCRSRCPNFSGWSRSRTRVAASPAPHQTENTSATLYRQDGLTSSRLLYDTDTQPRKGKKPRSAPLSINTSPIPSRPAIHSTTIRSSLRALAARLSPDGSVGLLESHRLGLLAVLLPTSASQSCLYPGVVLTVHFATLISASGLGARTFSAFSPRRTAREATAR